MTRAEVEKKVEKNVSSLVTHIQAYSSKCQTEEAAKHALVLPFLQFVLGWDIFNPTEVIPEFTADTGIKRGEKVDYAVMKKGKIAFIIECKMPGAKLESSHASQLYRYFGTLLPCRIAILTDGVRYLFYTDTENPNVLDSAPFFTVDFTKPEMIMIEELSQFAREIFDVDDVTRTATQLMHAENVKAYLVRQLDSPSDEFVKLLISASDANAKFSTKNAEIMRSIVKKSFESVVQSRVHQALKTAQVAESQGGNTAENGQAAGGTKEIVTTVEEWEGFYTVRTLLHDVVQPERVQFKDTVSYFNVLLDGNPRQQICRFYFNNPRKYLGLFSEKGETKKEIGGVADLYLLKREFASAVLMYESKSSSPQVSM
jgi:hypothetical protein